VISGRVDARFLLPGLARTAVVLGDMQEWRDGLTASGVEIVKDGAADLVVSPAELIDAALEYGTEALIVEGKAVSRHLLRSGLYVQRFLPLPTMTEPALFLPIDQRRPAAYVVERWITPPTRLKALRNRAFRAILAARAVPPIRPVATVAVRRPGPPFLVAEAGPLGVPREAGWFLAPGQGDVLSRGAFYLFPPRSAVPAWALKFTRVPGYNEAFERDQRGLEVAASAGEVAIAHAPRLLGRFQFEGVHASVETAAVGQRLIGFLHSFASRRAKEATVNRIARWIVELGVRTAARPVRLTPERQRLDRDVLPRWTGARIPNDLVADLPPLPAVLQHNDLGSWNVVVDGPRFTAVDWENARRFGFPMWDLWYFLAEATAHLEVPGDVLTHFRRLFRGELTTSSLLFAWTRQAVRALDIPLGAVGALATMCWVHHGVLQVTRRETIERYRPGLETARTPFERMAQVWLTDPRLGLQWRDWQE
jgi:Phosphotransferase enzyme family